MMFKFLKGKNGLKRAYPVRKNVFIDEEGIDPSIEIDVYDDIATHLVVYQNKKPIGTARFFYDGKKYYIGRVAVIKKYRGKRIGKKIMERMIDYAVSKGINEIWLHSQTYIKDFYLNLGFEPIGEEFLEAGIPHIAMVWRKKET